MKQLMILAIVSLLVAAASGAWFGAFIAPPRKVIRDSGSVVAKAPAAAAKTASAPSAPVTNDSAAAKPTPPSLPGTPLAGPKVDTAGEGARAKGVAKVLSAMKAKDAADIMARLTDDEVERIVRQLNAKQLAALLAVLPEERAALLSRRLLEPRTGRQGGS